jgi:tetratricopeptide (TPR) repeat protein
MNVFKLIVLIACLLCAIAEAKPKQDKSDFINLAALLIKDGFYQRALTALESVDLNAEEIDLIRYYTLKGLAYLSLQDLPSAKIHLINAVKAGQTDPSVFVYLAQTHYGLKEYGPTIDAVNKAGAVIHQYPALFEMQAQSYWNLEQHDQAIAVLNKAQAMFPDNHQLTRRKVFYWLDLGLYRMAAELGLHYLETAQAGVKDYIAIGNALRLSKQFDDALQVLELAKLRFNQDAMVAKVLAHTYLDLGQPNVAGQIFEQAALYDSSLAAEASEIYRRAGRYYRALQLNAGIPDQKTKLKQRLALMLALKRYEAAINMANELYRAGLLQDQSIRYALAYANFNVGDYPASIKHIEYLKEPELFKKGIELRRIMAECQQEPWQCL